MSAAIARLPGERLHLSEGPIDLVIGADGPPGARETAFAAAARRFEGLLAEVAAELPLLRRPLCGDAPPRAQGPIARRMIAACWPHRGVFVTPMAAVAGAVAEAVLAAMLDACAATTPLTRAYVNDGGDIDLYLSHGARLDVGVVRSLSLARPEGFIRLDAAAPSRGVATSGRHGRSFSLGIADAVTVLAARAADADVAATLIANAVDASDPAIRRAPASSLDPDSDLGDRLVTVEVGPLRPETIHAALDAGAACARGMAAAGLIHAALLTLAGQWREVG